MISSQEAPRLGGTYADNVVYAWAEVPPGFGAGPINPVTPNSSFGVRTINWDGTTSTYTVAIEVNDQNGAPAMINKGSVTATIESGGPTDPGCATIAVSSITASSFKVWTHFVDFGSTTCRALPYGFSFKVCGRP
jgi:hypothetical protein